MAHDEEAVYETAELITEEGLFVYLSSFLENAILGCPA